MNKQPIPFLSVFVFRKTVVHAEGAASKNIRQGRVYDMKFFEQGTFRLDGWKHLKLVNHCSAVAG